MADSEKDPISGAAASKEIDGLIASLDDWRGETLATIRGLVHEALPDVTETWKWMGSPVWESDGIVLLGNAHKDKVKLTFPHGADVPDPDGVFNNGLDGKAWRAVDLHEGDRVDPAAFTSLVKAAAAVNADRKS